MIHSGQAFLFRGRDEIKPHLWFVLTDPDGDPPRVLAVMLQSVKRHTEKTRILNCGDHPFVRHPSAIMYGTVRPFTVGKLEEAIGTGSAHWKEDMSPSLLASVREGLLQSHHTPNGILEECRKRFQPRDQ